MSAPDTEQFKATDASSYDAVVAAFDEFTARFTTPLAEHVAGLAGGAAGPAGRVLDVGCGTGVVAAAVARAAPAARVVGVDLSDGMLRRAADRAAALGLGGRVEYRKMDAEALALGDGEFDAVVSLFALMHFPSPGAALGEMYRVLRPGGGLVVAVGSGPALFSRAGLARGVGRCAAAVRRWRGRYLTAPDFLEGLARKHLPPTGAAEESALAGSGVRRPGRVARLVADAGFTVTGRSWIGAEPEIGSPDEFWELQRTYSSLVRKRLAAAAPAAVSRLREEFFGRCNRVLVRGGRLTYPHGAYVVTARRG